MEEREKERNISVSSKKIEKEGSKIKKTNCAYIFSESFRDITLRGIAGEKNNEMRRRSLLFIHKGQSSSIKVAQGHFNSIKIVVWSVRPSVRATYVLISI